MWILGLKGLISYVEKSSNSEHFVGMTPNQTVKYVCVCVCVLEMEFQAKSFLLVKCTLLSGLSLRARDRGFSPATKRVAPSYFYWKIEEK